VVQLILDYTAAPVSPAESALLDFAVKLTREPWSMTREHVGKLREAGWSDRAILDLTLVASYYNFVNRLADGLGVELEARWSDKPQTEHR
jgi:uncharacterized peroxidase-related enzyme